MKPMCEANVYMIDEKGREALLLEKVDKVIPDGDRLILQSIFGQQKIVKARIRELALVEHRILLEKTDAGEGGL